MKTEWVEASFAASAKIRWSNINRHIATKDVLCLFDGKVQVTMFPHAPIPPEVEKAILEAIK